MFNLVIILLILLILLIWFIWLIYFKPNQANTPFLNLYKILDITNQILTQNSIKYWLDGGSFLGAIRHQGIIPWDDDADIQIMHTDEDKLFSKKKDFEAQGLQIVKTWFGFKVFLKESPLIEGKNFAYPSLDIFVMEEVGNKILFKYIGARKSWPKCYVKTSSIKNLFKYKFGNLLLSGPDPKFANEYLERCYGKDWNEVGYISYDHKNETKVDKKKFILSDEDRKPAPY